MEPEKAMDQVDTWVHGTFNSSAYFALVSCFADEVGVVSEMADGALDKYIQTTQSVPVQAFSAAALVASLCLLFMGINLVRAVNFFGGFYVGSSLSLFLLDLFAVGTPLVSAPQRAWRPAPAAEVRRAV